MAMTTIQNLMAKKAELVAEMRAHGADALKIVFREFFEAHPACAAVRWRQYTPFFNDGDSCEFRVGDLLVKMVDAPEGYEGDYGDGFDEAFLYPSSEANRSDAFKAAAPALKEIGRIDDDFFEMAFGDHAQVTATRDGFEVEEYEHE